MFVLAVTASSRDLNPSIILDQTDRLSHLHGNGTSSLMYRILSIPPRAGGNHAVCAALAPARRTAYRCRFSGHRLDICTRSQRPRLPGTGGLRVRWLR